MFLPNSPNAQTGVSVAVEPDKIQILNIPTADILEAMEHYGAGLGAMAEQSLSQGAVAENRDPSN